MIIARKNLFAAILAALLFSCTLALFGPAQLFLTNALEFDFTFYQLLPFLGVVTFCVFLTVLIILMLLPDRFKLHERGVAVVLALSILFWAQGNLLLWKYGELDGHEIEWGKKILYGVIDTPLWLGLLILSAWRPKFPYRWVRIVSIFLLLMQLFMTSFYVLKQPELPNFKKFRLDHTCLFDLSSRKNVIILVLDGFPSDIFQEIIDKDPEYGRFFKDFTYFRNAVTGFPTTYGAIPFILTAQRYTNSVPVQEFLKSAFRAPSSIPHGLLMRNWQVDLYPSVPKTIFFDNDIMSNLLARRFTVDKSELAYLYDITLFRYLPHFLKRPVFNNEHWLLTNLVKRENRKLKHDDKVQDTSARQSSRKKSRKKRGLLSRMTKIAPAKIFNKKFQETPDVKFLANFLTRANAEIEQNVFKFYHMRGLHRPVHMNAELDPVRLPFNRENFVDMARGEIKLANFFLEGLRELGVYDNALIFILGDHGQRWGGQGLKLTKALGGTQTVNVHVSPQVVEVAIPLLLVKRPGSNKDDLTISDAPACLADVSATVFAELGYGHIGPGEPLFQLAPDRVRERFFAYYKWSHSDWLNPYLPAFTEYRINGHAWLYSSWHATGNVFKPGE